MAPPPEVRVLPPPHADERTTLAGWLDFHRGTLAAKCSGIDDQQARQTSAEPSPMTLLGLVRHLTVMEHTWIHRTFAGSELPPTDATGDPSGFTLPPGQSIEEALTTWRAAVERSRELTAEASLTDPVSLLPKDAAIVGSKTVSPRWVLVHLIEEYARHNGHADLLRERVDGTTGF